MTRKTRQIEGTLRRAANNALLETLEPRRMMATFNGTSGNDTIDIFNWAGGGMAIRINGVTNTTTDTSITVNAGLGNDTFNASSSRSGTTVLARGEGGNDTMTNPSVLDLDLYVADFTFDGGTGTDLVIADNSNDSATTVAINIRGSGVSKGTDLLIGYDNVEAVEYWDSNNDTIIGFSDAHTASDNIGIEINAAGGNDFIFNGVAWDSSIGTGGVQIDAGAGSDTISLVNNASTTTAFQFIGNNIIGSLSGSGTGTLMYFGCENLNFTGGSHNESIAVNSKTSVTALNVNGGNGNDNFTIGNNDFDDSGLLTSNTTIVGGAGTDSMTVQDWADKDEAGEVENYNWFTTTLTKGTAGINYSEIENQTLVTANTTVSGQLSTIPQVNLNSISSSVAQTTVGGGNARGCIVNVGAGNLTNINGDVFLNLAGTGFDAVSFYHDLSNVSTTFRIGYSQLVAPRTVNFTNAANVSIHAGAQSDTFFIDGSAAATNVVVNGNNGNDTFHLGGGNLNPNLLGPVTCAGGAGTNHMIVDNTLDATFAAQSLNGTTFTDGQSHTFSSMSDLVVNGGPGGIDLTVNSTNIPTTINGGAGTDLIKIGNGSLATALGTNVTVNGNGGTDSLLFLGQDDSGTRTYAFPAFDKFRFGDTATGKIVTFSGIESGALLSGTGRDDIDAAFVAIPLSIFSGAGNDSVVVSVSNAQVTVDTGSENPGAAFGTPQGDALTVGGFLGSASVVVATDDTLINLVVSAGSSLRLDNGAILNKTWPTGFFIDLGPNLTGTIDLGSGALLWRDGGGVGILPDFRGLLSRGYGSGAWNGTSASGAINSSVAAGASQIDALGYGLGSEIAINSIGGFNIAAGDMLVRYTFYGDTDLNQVVDFDDYVRTDAGFNSGGTGWTNGDFNYDNFIDFDDFVLIDSAFNNQ